MSDWKTLAIEKCEQYALELRHEDELWEVFSDYCNPCGHIEIQQTKIEKLQTDLALARKGLEDSCHCAWGKVYPATCPACEAAKELDKKDGE